MKKILIYLLLIATLSCETYVEPTTFSFSVTAYYPSEINNGEAIANTEIIVRNTQTSREFIQYTNENGQATFNVRGGSYDIILSFSEEHNLIIDNFPAKKTLIFSGSLNGQLVMESGTNFQINTQYNIEKEDFIIKELYSSGSRTPDGENYGADKFVEIYNNSDEILYSDGLCFGAVRYEKTFEPSIWIDNEGNLLPRIPLWSFVAIVPGSGEDYPIQPGESFVIALSGLNHKDDPNGNPNSIDLSGSAWEMIVEDGKYADVPGVPNCLMQRLTLGTAMSMNTKGMICILFRLPSDNYEEVFTNTENFMVEPGGSFNCFMVPYAWVIDGVENPSLDDRGVYKRLPNSIDIGYIQHRGSYEGVSIKRKVKEVIDGRTIYQDTNNSTNDFLTNQEPTPGVIATN
ncbi:MAG TPA: DUF4876 domain-containing protein [Draconibacterium sp.]|nr:DUF4876 domain-containing protein [Draconibacterium sp.]